jgi:hypothetical protein
VDVAVAPKDRQDWCNLPVQERPSLIQFYEPNTFGYTKQGNDVAFVDFTLSIKAQLLRDGFCRWFGNDRNRLYLTFTGRFGFYVATRSSGPVIAKSYNPKLLWRMIRRPELRTRSAGVDRKAITEYAEYVDIAYAHDSNGQSIDTEQEYAIQSYQVRSAAYALDYISRGWDYVQVTAKHTLTGSELGKGTLTVYPDFKFFLRHGFLQGVPEEYHSWEHDTALRPRHAFDGLSATIEYQPFAKLVSEGAQTAPWASGIRLALKYTTGYAPVARYNTVRGELGFLFLDLPWVVWAQDGYMNSLARYYRKTSSVGVELRFADF